MCVCVCLKKDICVCIYMCVYIYMCLCVCVCVCVCEEVHICNDYVHIGRADGPKFFRAVEWFDQWSIRSGGIV